MPDPISLHGGLSVSEESLHGSGITPKEQSLHGNISAVAGGTIVRWGKITGDIAKQEDLMAELENLRARFDLLSAIAYSGSVDDLNQDTDSFFILDCGSSSRIIGE